MDLAEALRGPPIIATRRGASGPCRQWHRLWDYIREESTGSLLAEALPIAQGCRPSSVERAHVHEQAEGEPGTQMKQGGGR